MAAATLARPRPPRPPHRHPVALAPAGLIVRVPDGPAVTALYRPLRRPARGFRPGDLRVPAHVLLSDEFGASAEGEARFGRGGHAAWLADPLMPALARLMVDSVVRGDHFEVHGQNLVATVDRHGRLVDLAVKDALDVKHDPVLVVARTGRLPPAAARPRSPMWGHIGEGRDATVFAFYAHWLEQMLLWEDLAYELRDLIDRALTRATRAEVVRRVGVEVAATSPWKELDDGRAALILQGLRRRFRPDPTMRARFAALPAPAPDGYRDPESHAVLATDGSSWRAQLGEPGGFGGYGADGIANDLSFGRIGDVPVAIWEKPSGPVAYFLIGDRPAQRRFSR